MSRLAIFAFWDKDSIINDYVLYYLKKLSMSVDNIIFSADCDIDENELEKIRSYAQYIINGRHMEYDFGSYKRGFLFAKENNLLNDIDELIFCNDSCFGPFFVFLIYFEKMSKSLCDFWGMNLNKQIKIHIGSFFLVFGKKVFNSDSFFDFINNVKKENSKQDVILNYETSLTQYLYNSGFSYGYCFPYPSSFRIYNTIFNEIKNRQYPFLKKSILFGQFNFITNFMIKRMETQIKSDYPFNFITKYYQVLNKNISFFIKLNNFIKLLVTYFVILPRARDRFYLFNKWYERS